MLRGAFRFTSSEALNSPLTTHHSPHDRSAQTKPHLLVIGAAVLWGTTGTAQALAPPGASPSAVGTVRLLIGAFGLLALARFRVAKPSAALFVAAAGMAGYQLAFFSGVARTGVATGTLVAIGSAPLLAGLGARVLRGERLSRWWWVATGLAVTGLILLAAPGQMHEPFGLLLALLAGACYSAYAIASKDLLAMNDPVQVMAGVFTVAAITLAAVTRLDGVGWAGEGWPVALWLGVVATTIAYALFARGLRRLPVRSAATLSLAEPVTASVLAVLILGERPNAWAWFGMALVVVGITVAARESELGRRKA